MAPTNSTIIAMGFDPERQVLNIRSARHMGCTDAHAQEEDNMRTASGGRPDVGDAITNRRHKVGVVRQYWSRLAVLAGVVGLMGIGAMPASAAPMTSCPAP